MRLVEDDEGLRVEAPAEPVHEQRDDRGCGVAAREPHAVLQMLEAEELQHTMPLVHDGAGEAVERLDGRVGEVAQHAAAGLARAGELPARAAA